MAPMSIPSMVPWAVVLGLRKFHPFCSVHGRDQHTDGHTDWSRHSPSPYHTIPHHAIQYSFNNVADIRNLQQYCSIQHYRSGRTKVYDSYRNLITMFIHSPNKEILFIKWLGFCEWSFAAMRPAAAEIVGLLSFRRKLVNYRQLLSGLAVEGDAAAEVELAVGVGRHGAHDRDVVVAVDWRRWRWRWWW